ncbi:class I SAM-dependent methyltransferase [Rhodopila globiformis]|uniref:SAM-dependent methyltransferase n=1 Tax=Rhodopila globiformis TaxID=1071 RepID=A0A2S6N4A0_RHOGL|nr:class I SAM-dependent methyltransferase [Rhodopila globiformis]PPQ29436.1 SAM-dependent methyltransferase [Rhodopila globiformis]
MNIQTAIPAAVDYAAIKARQRAVWSAGDYARIGVTLQIVGETLCEAVDLGANHRVLDVCAGNGNATLAAARRFADVVSTDYVEDLLDRGRARAAADGFDVRFEQADAEALPFDDENFDIVLSTFGVMFTPDQQRAADEMLRVLKPGGRIGLANWTPAGFVGQLLRTVGARVPPPPGVRPPVLWGEEAHLASLFGSRARVATQRRSFVFRYRSPAHWVQVFRTLYGPLVKAFAALDEDGQRGLEAELHALIGRFNTARDGAMVVPGDYLEVVATKV